MKLSLAKARICLAPIEGQPPRLNVPADVYVSLDGDMTGGWLAYFHKPDAQWHEAVYVPRERVYFWHYIGDPHADQTA